MRRCYTPFSVDGKGLSCLSRALAGYPSFYVAVGSRHVVMVSILSVGGYFVGANGGCQTPCLVISEGRTVWNTA